MGKQRTLSICAGALAVFALAGPGAEAATATGTFTSTITLQASCQVASTNTLDFGTQTLLTANVDVQADLSVQCTNTTPYNIGLNAGSTAGGTVATRLMTSGAATVQYRMYSDSARIVNWGNTPATDTVSGSGNGSAQSLTIYGRVPAQATPAAAIYSDTVTVTINY